MNQMIKLSLVCLFILNVGCSSHPQVCSVPAIARDSTPREITILNEDLSLLRDAFNQRAGQWRAVALVSPTCSECVLGAEAVEKEITARYTMDQIDALIVWIPMLETDNQKVAHASATIFSPTRVTQFYDNRQTFGTRLAQQTFAGFHERARKSLSDDHWLAGALDDRIEVKRPQWDLYMLYAPGIRWEQSSDAPPMPAHWIRHLGRKETARLPLIGRTRPKAGRAKATCSKRFERWRIGPLARHKRCRHRSRLKLLASQIPQHAGRKAEHGGSHRGLVSKPPLIDDETGCVQDAAVPARRRDHQRRRGVGVCGLVYLAPVPTKIGHTARTASHS